MMKVSVIPSSLAVAEIITFFAPAFKCALANSVVTNLPADSNTTSTSKSFQGKSPGFFAVERFGRGRGIGVHRQICDYGIGQRAFESRGEESNYFSAGQGRRNYANFHHWR